MDVLYVARGPRVALTYYFSDLIRGAAAATATFLLAQRFDGIGTWTKAEVLFLLAYAIFVRMLIDLFFNYNLAHVSRRIGRGQLDHLLIQPQPLWVSLVTEGFAPATGSGMLLPAALLFGAASQQLDLALTPGWCALFVVELVGRSSSSRASNTPGPAWHSGRRARPRRSTRVPGTCCTR
jgi:ABC-2 type transport system permease protein